MPRLISPEVKAAVIGMRRQGHSINQIAAATGIAKSSVSRFVRDVSLTEAQREALRPLASRRGSAHLAWSRQHRARRRGAQLMGRALAQLNAPDYVAGVMLYWAEGTKNRNAAAMTNSDPDLLRVWLDWLEDWHCDRSEAALTINCFLGNGRSLEEIESWWLDELRLPRSSLRRSRLNSPSKASKGVRRKLVDGTARVQVNSTFVVQCTLRRDPGDRRLRAAGMA